MSEGRVDLFVEDHAHEAFVGAVVKRLAKEAGLEVATQVRCGRGGHGRVLSELKHCQAMVKAGAIGAELPDLFVVAIDANCTPVNEARRQINEALDEAFQEHTVIACPDPHIERWFLADPDTFMKVVGYRPTVRRGKCERDLYKQMLKDACIKGQGGNLLTLGGIEFADELVTNMDFFKAGKHDPSLGAFVGDLHQALIRLAHQM